MDSTFWDARYAASPLVWSADANVWVVEVCSQLTPGRAVDIAAGEGRNAFWLAERGWDVVATDFSGVAVDRMRALADERGVAVTAYVSDATQVVPDAPFDLAVLAYLHLPPEQWRAALSHAVEATVPGGRVLVVQHASRNLTEGTGGPQDPTLLHDPEALVATAEGLPVEVEQARFATREVAVDPGHRGAEVATATAYDTVVVLRRT